MTPTVILLTITTLVFAGFLILDQSLARQKYNFSNQNLYEHMSFRHWWWQENAANLVAMTVVYLLALVIIMGADHMAIPSEITGGALFTLFTVIYFIKDWMHRKPFRKSATQSEDDFPLWWRMTRVSAKMFIALLLLFLVGATMFSDKYSLPSWVFYGTVALLIIAIVGVILVDSIRERQYFGGKRPSKLLFYWQRLSPFWKYGSGVIFSIAISFTVIKVRLPIYDWLKTILLL